MMLYLETVRVFGIAVLALATKAYMPPAVEIPPVDEKPMAANGYPQRDSTGRRHVQYSYGTTAYQPASAVPGFTARVSQEPSHYSPVTPATPSPQRPECQHPKLRLFFKTCYPPGAAPQSPVQCQPIPGQTSFRCLIKPQGVPVVSSSQCSPGTVYSSAGHCLPVGSFSTGGVVVVPIVAAAPGRNQFGHSTTNVYRHCGSGLCQTCIGDQCSTTGVLTPVSVDQRGRVNSSTEVVAFGDAGRDVKQKCAGTLCKTCIDRICYDRSFPLLRVTAGCPPAVCETQCTGFVYWTDQCPICQCQGFACREPCRSQGECPAGSTCRDQVCVYPELPANQHFDKVCTFSSQCPGSQMCYNWRCGSKPAQSRHLEDHSCAVDHDCPSGYICADMTCWEGAASQLKGQACLLEHQCPTGYFCTNGACSDVYHHGSFDSYSAPSPTIAPTTNRQCDHDRQCYGGETCFENRCVSYNERRQMEEARQRQQSEHRPWAPPSETYTYQPPTAPPVPESGGRPYYQGQTPSPEEDYQRRLAEYNRQKMEEGRQQTEHQRQMEQDRRRQEEEIQRRREKEEKEERWRQEQEIEKQRRLQAQEESRRRLQGDDENQRRQREYEEAQRRAAETEQQNRLLKERQEREENMRRQEEMEARRRQDDEERRNQYQPVPTPDIDIEVGEEAPEGPPEYDPGEEYERRMREYYRQLQERQKQSANEQEDHRISYHRPSQPTDNGDREDDDFYSRTKQRGRPGISRRVQRRQ